VQFHAVASGQADKAFAHFSGDMREDHVIVRQLHAEHRSARTAITLPSISIAFRVHIECGAGIPVKERRPQNQTAGLSAVSGELPRTLFACARFVHGQGAAGNFLPFNAPMAALASWCRSW
jgi:hypothetical protein